MTGHNQPAVPAHGGQLNGDRRSPTVAMALDWAEVAAMLGDYRDALAWLDYVERIEGRVPNEYAERRRSWLTRTAAP